MDKVALRDQWVIAKRRWPKELSGWTLSIFEHKTHFGQCAYGSKTIFISRYLLENGAADVEVIDTLLHEIAHAINRYRNGSKDDGHGPKWKSICVEIGARPERLSSYDVKYVTGTPYFKYTLTCPSCGQVYNFSRRHFQTYKCVECNVQMKLAINEKPKGGD